MGVKWGESKSSSSINLPKADMRHENLVLMGSNGVKMEFFSISSCKWEVNCALLLVKTAYLGKTWVTGPRWGSNQPEIGPVELFWNSLLIWSYQIFLMSGMHVWTTIWWSMSKNRIYRSERAKNGQNWDLNISWNVEIRAWCH